MNTVELHCIIQAEKYKKQNIADILVAQLSELGYHGFQDTPDGLKAYVAEKDFSLDEIRYLPILFIYPGSIELHHQIIAEKNWNEEWEKGFKPVKIGSEILIKAPFHEEKEDFRYEIIIEPKMSFGTGHHSTTYLMLETMLELDLANKNILDMGCGTGILSILASKMGAKQIWAVDINDWAYKNTLENISINSIQNIKALKGNSKEISARKFDIILANINLNALLEDIREYSNCLPEDGKLILSGIYMSDIKEIRKEADKNNLHFNSYKERNLWVALEFTKKDIKSL